MNNFRKFEKITIRGIVLSTFRTTGPRQISFAQNLKMVLKYETLQKENV